MAGEKAIHAYGDALAERGVQAVEVLGVEGVGQPGDLALGRLVRRENPAVAQFLARNDAFLRFPGLALANATHRRQTQAQRVFGAQRPHFLVRFDAMH